MPKPGSSVPLALNRAGGIGAARRPARCRDDDLAVGLEDQTGEQGVAVPGIGASDAPCAKARVELIPIGGEEDQGHVRAGPPGPAMFPRTIRPSGRTARLSRTCSLGGEFSPRSMVKRPLPLNVVSGEPSAL